MICMCSTELYELKFVSSHKNVGTGIPPRNCGVLPPVFKHHSSLSSCSSKREPVASTIIVVLVIVTSVSLSDLHLLCAAWINTAVCPFLREAGHGVSSADSLHPSSCLVLHHFTMVCTRSSMLRKRTQHAHALWMRCWLFGCHFTRKGWEDKIFF